MFIDVDDDDEKVNKWEETHNINKIKTKYIRHLYVSMLGSLLAKYEASVFCVRN